MKKQQQRGFTLVELVIVILILGVLAATALPRFLNIQDDAHEAANAGIGGALASGISLAHAAWMVDAKGSGAADNLGSFGASDIDTNTLGWPTDTGGNNTISASTANCMNVWNGILDSAPSVATDTNSDYQATVALEVCTFISQGDTSHSIVYNAGTGSVTVN